MTRPSDRLDKSILIIDDEPELADAIEDLLRQLVTRVRVENTAESGLSFALLQRPDLVLCDVRMPIMNGFQLRQQMMREPFTSMIPFIFISADQGVETQLTAFRLGATDYLTKPFLPSTLQARVLHLLQHRPEHLRVGGDLRLVPSADLLQLFASNQSSGALTVVARDISARVVFENGHVASADSGAHQGEDGVFDVLCLANGRFTFEPAARTMEPQTAPAGGEPAIDRLSKLVLDAMVLRDDLARLGRDAPLEHDRIVALHGLLDVPPLARFAADESLQGSRVSEIARALGLGVYRCRVLLGEAIHAGAARALPRDRYEDNLDLGDVDIEEP